MSLQELLAREPKGYYSDEWQQWQQECRTFLESKHGQVWDTNELTNDFNIESFLAPFCFGTRRSDGKAVSIMFYHHPRFYYDVKER